MADALRVRGLKQEQLARVLGTTQSSVSGWINGKYEPPATTVFRIEQALGLEPGRLSRPLGYLPLDAMATQITLEAAILQSPDLDDAERDALVSLYRVLAGRRRTAPQAVPARPRPLTSAGNL